MLRVPPTICLTWPACRSMHGRKRVILNLQCWPEAAYQVVFRASRAGEKRGSSHLSEKSLECTAGVLMEGLFSAPFHRSPGPRAWPLEPFLKLWRAKRPGSLHQKTVAHVFDIHSHSPSPSSSSEGPILAPRALSPKWASLHLPYATCLAVHIRLCYQPRLRRTSSVYSPFT